MRSGVPRTIAPYHTDRFSAQRSLERLHDDSLCVCNNVNALATRYSRLQTTYRPSIRRRRVLATRAG